MESVGVFLQEVSEPKKRMGDEAWDPTRDQPRKRQSWEMSVRANQQLGNAFFHPDRDSPEPFIPGLLKMSFGEQQKAISDYYKDRPNPPLYDAFLKFCKTGELAYIEGKCRDKFDKVIMAEIFRRDPALR